MATAEDVIRIAEGELGRTDGTKYFSHFGVGNLGAWCVVGLRWCYDMAGVKFPWDKFYAWDERDVPAGARVSKHDLRKGDGVAFDWDTDDAGDHVGLVTGVYDWGVATIEFNTSGGKVDRKQRVWDVIICGIRPTFTEGTGEWVDAGDGRWWWREPTGSFPRKSWKNIDGKWYWFDASGWLGSGWLEWDNKWYWLHDKHDGRFGEMAESTCVEVDGAWYAFGEDGAMKTVVKTNSKHDGTYGRLLL